jgi:outer membrane protein TolC
VSRRRALLMLAFAPAALAPEAKAQQATPAARGPADSLRLGALVQDALHADPRTRQLQLQTTQTDLRLRTIDAERLPAFTAEGQAQYQSEVVTIPFQLPNGQRIPSPKHDTYDARVGVQQSILDPSVGARRSVERAQLTESQARVRTTLFSLRAEVNESFFAAALLQERASELAAIITGLDARLREAGARVRERAALPSDTAAIVATILQRRQDEAELRANRRAALARLSELTGRPIAEGDGLALPDLAAAVAQARGSIDSVRARPEYEQFAATRERLARQEGVQTALEQPRVSAFGRFGYGRPGLNLLSDQFDTYWTAGVQVQWTPWTWGTVGREREALAVQREIVAADEAAFMRSVRRIVQNDLAAMDRLDSALVIDERIIALREGIEREAQLRFREGVLTASEYLDRSTDVLNARLARAAHRVEQAQARARFLTTLGLEVR